MVVSKGEKLLFSSESCQGWLIVIMLVSGVQASPVLLTTVHNDELLYLHNLHKHCLEIEFFVFLKRKGMG